jgi:hypothetical protein
MLNQEDIEHQLKLLEAHRRTLAHSLEQYHALGVLTPPALAHSIREAWTSIAQIKTTLRVQSVDVTDEPVDEPHELHITVPTLSPTERRNRQRMLQKVRDFWIKGVLENSLHGAALIELGMEYKPDAVHHPWDMVIRQPDQPSRAITHETKISNVFDKLGGELLILGAPGSGKTTMLLELARDLLGRAEHDESYPIPVVFNLSSWAEKRKPLLNWLIDELNTKYDVPRKIGKDWMEVDYAILLLDGLDEVKDEHRDECVEAINSFRAEHGLVNLAVSSRIADYEALRVRLKLQGAILVEPLTIEQIDVYLADFGDQLGALRAALTEDNMLRELAETPLLLSIMTLAYQGVLASKLATNGPIEVQRKYVFDAYLERMFARRGRETRYSSMQTIHWLSWLARGMVQQQQSVFFVERLQPVWLLKSSEKFVYYIAVIASWIIAWTSIWAINGVMVDKIFRDILLKYNMQPIATIIKENSGLTIGLFGGLFIGITTGLLVLITGGRRKWSTIEIAERLQWSWSRGIRGLAFGLIIIIAVTLSMLALWHWREGLPVSAKQLFRQLPMELQFIIGEGGLIFLATIAITFTGILALVLIVATGITVGEIKEKTRSNQGVWQSARNAILMLFVSIVTVILAFFVVSIELLSPYTFKEVIVNDNLLWARSIVAILWTAASFLGLSIGLLVASVKGGSAVVQHFVLRLILWKDRYIPLRLVPFLDYCAERIFLRKVGGGYIFVHRMLMEYFASLDTSQPPGQSE